MLRRVVVEKVTKTFGRSVALRGVSGVFEAGELALVEGANGSGKSTLLSVLGRVVRPTSGSVRYEADGGELDDAELRRELGWVSHETLCYPDLTGRQNVELALRAHGLDPAALWAGVAARFELGEFAERPMRGCSRGQRQRVSLARALAHGPGLVLLDEPSTGLDARSLGRLRAVIREEAARGAVVVMVTHEPEAFAAEAGRRLVLERGRVAR